MKKLVIAIIVVFVTASSAMAENRVEVKVTSESIGSQSVCGKGGGFSLEFDSSTTLVHGDQITIDLEFDARLGQDVDLEISAGGNGGFWTGSASGGGNIPANGAPVIDPTQSSTVIGSGVYFRLRGVAGIARMTLDVIGNSLGDGIAVGPNPNDTLTLKFLDQKTNGTDFLTQPGVYIDPDKDGSYNAAATINDNVVCINVTNFDKSTVHANLDSRNDRFTFIPSNPQIAHIFGSVGYVLSACKAGIVPGDIAIGSEGAQSIDSCKPFDWDAAGDSSGYCSDRGDTPLLLIETMPSNFSFADVDYLIDMTILTEGVYFTNQPVYANAFSSAASACEYGAADTQVGNQAEYYYENAFSNSGTPIDINDLARANACVPRGDAVFLRTNCAPIIGGSNLKVLSINIPKLKYNINQIQSWEPVLIRVALRLCSNNSILFTTDIDLGRLGCIGGEGGGSHELVYSYYTSMVGDNFWDGFSLVNLDSVDGTATLYFNETDGDKGYMTVSVPAGKMFVRTLSDMFMAPAGGQIVDPLTKTSGDGMLGDARLYIVACTDFKCDGFAFMGRSQDANAKGESMGYQPRNSAFGESFDLCE